MAGQTVREATFDVWREYGLTSIFANPGSTEIQLLSDLPSDFRFVLALHEGSVVGMATGWALGRGEPALAILHTTAGLGNAVGALATARVNRAPLVVVVGQQDRRHLATQPFLAGRLRGLAGEYPVWVDEPVRPQDVPGAIARAVHEAASAKGPALVIVPMDDWLAPAGAADERAAPRRVVRARAADGRALAELAELVSGASAPALVVGAGADDPEAWRALVALAERLGCPVWQESFSSRAGFPQDHPQFAGHLPADRIRLRELLAPHDVVLVVGAPVFRQYPFIPGPFVHPGTVVAMVSDDPDEVHRSTADLGLLAAPGPVCAELVRLLPARESTAPPVQAPPDAPDPPAAGEPMRAADVFAAMADRLPRTAIVIEESPSSRPELLARLPARESLGSLSPAMGGLGFALPASIGLRMARPDRPVVAIVGDGSSLYSIQALWSAAQYRAGALFVILSNGGYAIMDRLAEQAGGTAPWPGFAVDVAGLARAFGCPARTVRDHADLLEVLDEVLPGLADRDEPLLLEVVVAPDATFAP
ncbi:MAG TPA: thiamine pyrophosphate-dependent enzyme [Gaiellales bacterium]|nr:thiamine pyrophosphate-dependent enzyme [Gaiellales bacterium]